MRVFSVPPNGTWLSCGEGRRDREVDGREDERPFCSHELVRGVSGVVDCVLMHGFSEVSAKVAWSRKTMTESIPGLLTPGLPQKSR